MNFYSVLQSAFDKKDFSFLKDENKKINMNISLAFEYADNILKKNKVNNIIEFYAIVKNDNSECKNKKYFLDVFQQEYVFYQ